MVSVRKFPAQYCPLLADVKKSNLMILEVKGKLESSERNPVLSHPLRV